MSHIESLLRKHCPEGVMYRALGEVAKIKNGRDHKGLADGEIPVYGSGGVMRRVDTAAAHGPAVLIPRKGSLGNLFYVEGPFWVVDTIFRTEIDTLVLEPKFLYYQLLTMGLGEMNQAGGVPSQTQSVLAALRIPTPSREVQREIVRVLDQFAELEAKLEAELEAEVEARRVQYGFYRDAMILGGEAPLVLLGDLGKFVRGRRFTKADVVPDGIPSIHYGEIYTHYGPSASETLSRVREDLEPHLRFAGPGDVIFAAVGETVGDVGKAVAWLGDGAVAINDDTFALTSPVDPLYVAHAAQTALFKSQKASHVARGKVKRLGSSGLASIVIPVPSPIEQRRIVEQLSAFEALVNGLNEGLPAELKARRRQYEYYRDKLLTFEEAAS